MTANWWSTIKSQILYEDTQVSRPPDKAVLPGDSISPWEHWVDVCLLDGHLHQHPSVFFTVHVEAPA